MPAINALLALVISAIGNRMWGSGKVPHWSGALVMAIAVVVALPALWMWFPVFFGTIYIFRCPATSPWLDIMNNPPTPAIIFNAVKRGIWIFPHAIVLYALTHNFGHLAVAVCFPVIALIYYMAGRQTRFDPTITAELLTGAYVGLVAVA